MMKEFLTTEKTQPPAISLFFFILMMALLVLLGWLSYKYRDNERFSKLFKGIQIVQLICLYAWYIGFKLPLANSLPLYHCRLAMFALVFLPDRWSIKQYLAILGVSGAVFALGYPVFDPYDFPHITAFSFLVGHYALFVNGLIYLFNHYQPEKLSNLRIVLYTMVLNAVQLGVNQVTGGNYGLLKNPPLLNDTSNLLVNYLAVTGVLTLALLLVNAICRSQYKKQQDVLTIA